MSRALVLGGGGPVGVGWHAGLIAGLADAGVMLGDADTVVGTSAGSVVGAQLTSGHALADVVPPISTAPPWASSELRDGPVDIEELLASGAGDAVSEEVFVDHFGFLASSTWPETFRCTSFALDSGRFAIWDQDAGVELHRAVASSCSVPGLSPPVTIAGEGFIDGGAREMLNADLAVGHDIVVAVSCMALEPPDGVVPDLLAGLLPGVRQRLTRQSVLDALANIHDFDADGVIGKTDTGNHEPPYCIVMVQVKDGKWARVHPSKVGTFDCSKKNIAPLELDLTA
jgi:NTE family protein